MYQVLLVAYLLVALALIGLVLIQQGKGADMGASFGAGASNTVFGSSGAGNFLTRGTAFMATIFIVISLILGNLSANKDSGSDEWNNLGVESQAASEHSVQISADEIVEPKALPEADNKVAQEKPAKAANSDVPMLESAEVEAASQSDVPK